MVWSQTQWQLLDASVRRQLERAPSESEAWKAIVSSAQQILRSFSSSFFLVTRFLPVAKRSEVEVIYASVRFPDGIVDTFPLPANEQLVMLRIWEELYLESLKINGIRNRIFAGVPWILAGFSEIVIRRHIPAEHYLAFLSAMRRDACPKPFPTLENLIDEYVYGSAIVVGYFLSYVYGHKQPAGLSDALECARRLGIALQLTNFVRDVVEYHRHGRLYIPLNLLAQEGLELSDIKSDIASPEKQAGLLRAARALAAHAEAGYDFARRNLYVFSPDCRAAIDACIEVYGKLNRKFLDGVSPLEQRVSLSAMEKFRLLPPGKYWRVPLVYVRLI